MSGTAKINANIRNEKYPWRPYWALTTMIRVNAIPCMNNLVGLYNTIVIWRLFFTDMYFFLFIKSTPGCTCTSCKSAAFSCLLAMVIVSYLCPILANDILKPICCYKVNNWTCLLRFNKSKVVQSCLYSYRQRYSSSQWSKCCTPRESTSMS